MRRAEYRHDDSRAQRKPRPDLEAGQAHPSCLEEREAGEMYITVYENDSAGKRGGTPS